MVLYGFIMINNKFLFIAMCFIIVAAYGVIMVPKNEPLKKYQKKRSFKKTSEPSGRIKKTKKGNLFVIQKHDASHLHYDFRLEVDGVLVSWAIPKGPSTDPDVKHLAVMTEDHPLDYAKFEGVIPEGNYGAGTVMVWDIGTYNNAKEEYGISIQQALKDGKIEVVLHGKKMHGKYALIRTKLHDDKKNWLFFKMKEDEKVPSIKNKEKSALTNRTLLQIQKEAKTETKYGKR